VLLPPDVLASLVRELAHAPAGLGPVSALLRDVEVNDAIHSAVPLLPRVQRVALPMVRVPPRTEDPHRRYILVRM